MKFFQTATTISQAFKNVGRVTEILTVFVRHGFADLLVRMRLTRFLPNKITANPRFESLPAPQRLRLALEELGTTFIKLGQLLATRPDLIPEHFVEELEKLQDNVVKVPFPEIRDVLEAELKCPLTDVYSEFEEAPLAAASVAQVHGAVLKTGERVAVKVQRPGIAKLIQNDVSILRGLALLMVRYIPETRVLNPTGLVEEFFKTMLFELDFRVEGNNTRRIKRNLETLPEISVPSIYPTFCTERVLTMERFDGVRFSDREGILAQGITPGKIVEAGSDAFFHMVMHDGLFHGDLHAGNLFVLNTGKIGIIDFGIVGRLSRRVQDSIVIMFTALIDEDFETLATEYMNLCPSSGNPDINALQKDLMDAISPYIGMSLGEVNVGRILLRSTSIATRHSLAVPRELMLLFRAILTIEALGKKLDPNFDILQVGTRQARQIIGQRYSRERVLHDLLNIGRDFQGLLEILPRLSRRALRRWAQNNFAFEIRNRDIADLGHSLRQLTYFLVLIAFATSLSAIGIALLVVNRGPHIFGYPVAGAIPTALALILFLYGLWILRKSRKMPR